MERALQLATWLSASLLLAGLVMWTAGLDAAVLSIHAGLWVLIATPVTRVLLALTAFVRAKDVTFALLTLIVLACLAFPLGRYFLSFLR